MSDATEPGRHLLVVHHSRTGTTAALRDAVLAGAAAGSLISGGPASNTVTGTVIVFDNHVTDLSFQSGTASTAVHFTYSDFGTAPPVVAPKLTV